MPFGLKNARVIFQRMINKVYTKYISKNIETYIDDIVVKSEKANEYIKDLEKVFDMLRKSGVKLNPEKCVFRVAVRKFLEFMFYKRE